MTDMPIDPEVFANLVEMTGGETDFVDELVDTFIEDGGHQITTMREAAASSDLDALGRAAHSLKSGSLNVGALELGSLSRGLEEAGRGGDVPDPDARIDGIESAFDDARRELLAERVRRTPS
jgi:two-component system sensor histidine kinase/response regulator